jgi:hypothetical protein
MEKGNWHGFRESPYYTQKVEYEANHFMYSFSPNILSMCKH